MSAWLPKASIYSSIDDGAIPSGIVDEEAQVGVDPFGEPLESQQLRASASHRRTTRSLHGQLGPGSGGNGRQQYHALNRDDVLEEDDEEDGGPPRSLCVSCLC
jgi:hypothetical protein